MTPLNPGDRCYMLSEKGLKLRGVVPDYLMMKTWTKSGRKSMVPFQRNGRKTVAWVKRGDLRKLPDLKDEEGKPRAPRAKKPSPRDAIINHVDLLYRSSVLTITQAIHIIDVCSSMHWRKGIMEEEIAKIVPQKEET